MFRFAQHDSAICEVSSTHTKIDLDIFAEIIADFHHVQFIASSDRFGSSYVTGGTSSRLLRRGRETQAVFHRPYFAAANNKARSITPNPFCLTSIAVVAAFSKPSPKRSGAKFAAIL